MQHFVFSYMLTLQSLLHAAISERARCGDDGIDHVVRDLQAVILCDIFDLQEARRAREHQRVRM